jgi:hypothetical protein
VTLTLDTRHDQAGHRHVAVAGESTWAPSTNCPTRSLPRSSTQRSPRCTWISTTCRSSAPGIGALITGLHLVAERQTTFQVINARGLVHRVQAITGTLDILTGTGDGPEQR